MDLSMDDSSSELDAKRILPLPLYIHAREFSPEERKKYFEIEDQEEEKPMLEEILPLHINAKILDITDGYMSFRWEEDNRNLVSFLNGLDEYYQRRIDLPLENKDLHQGEAYVIKLDDEKHSGYYRCQIVSLATDQERGCAHVVDVGRVVQFDAGQIYHLDTRFFQGIYEYAFSSFCRLADENQCHLLSLPTFDQFKPKSCVEIFILSAQEPYYSVVVSPNISTTKLPTQVFVKDMLQEQADHWMQVTSAGIDCVPAQRSTLVYSPVWIHGNNPVIVNILKVENVKKIIISDLACSLRACLLTEMLREAFDDEENQDRMKITHPESQVGIGTCVIAYDPFLKRYFRAKITHLNGELSQANVVGIDYPQWSGIFDISELFLYPKVLQMIPAFVHYIPLTRKHEDFTRYLNSFMGILRLVCPPFALSIVDKAETEDLVIKVFNTNHENLPLIDITGIQDAYDMFKDRYYPKARILEFHRLSWKIVEDNYKRMGLTRE